MADTKVQVEELISNDIDLLHKKILLGKKPLRLPLEEKAYLIKLLELQQAKEAIEAVTKLDSVETELLEMLLKEINNERLRRIDNTTTKV